MIELKDITGEILFEESAHTYTRLSDGKPLCGVTTMLRDMGLAADYADIDPDVLARAADRGHLVHALCDRTDETGEPITEFDELEIYHSLKEKGIVTRLEEPTGMYEANEYLNLVKAENLLPVASEYLVSDGENIASCIDNVFTTELLAKENKVLLADKKSTSKIHEEPLAWQLSVYKHLFEAQNPHLKVVGLLGIWLPKKIYGMPKMSDVKEYAKADVENLIFCYANGIDFKSDLPVVTQEASLAPTKGLAQVVRAIDALEKRKEEMKMHIMQWMAQNGMKKLSQDGVEITYSHGVITSRFDSTLFKAEHPDLYEQYKRQVLKKESLMIKIKD